MVNPTRSALRYFELTGGGRPEMANCDPNQPLLDALRNPLRRSLLRRYVESNEMLNAVGPGGSFDGARDGYAPFCSSVAG
jgi:hypothetical protein